MTKLFGGYGSRINSLKSGALRKLFKIIYPPTPFINAIPKNEKQNIKKLVFGFDEKNRVLDVGSGISKGPGRWLWYPTTELNVTRVDLVEGLNVDLVADATDLPLPDESYDAVVLQSVIEHVEDLNALLSEAVRVLRKGGIIYIEMPFLQGVHGDPNDYWRMTQTGLNQKIEGLQVEKISSGVSGGPIGTMTWLFCDYLSNLTPINPINVLIRFITRWLLAPLRYIDILTYHTKASKRLACENYFIGAKK